MINKEQNQDYMNNELYIIYNELKKISNFNLDYMAALIYVMYKYRNENITPIKYNNFELVEVIDHYIKILSESDKNLFRNIRFINLINESNFEVFKNLIFDLYKLIDYIQDEKDILAEAFENLIISSVQNNEDIFNTGEFYTPKEIVKTMVDLVEIKDNMVIYNPFSGTGSFLKECYKQARVKTYKQEKNVSTYNIYKTNLWLNNVEEYEIMDDNFNCIKPDLAILNPPFSENILVKNLNYYRDPYLSTYTKYLVQMIDLVNKNGKVAIILPHGFLFKKADQAVRRELIERNLIDSIIALPENLFYRTRIPVIILLLDKNRMKKNVLFIDAMNEFVSKRKINYLSQENQDKIVSTYKQYKQVENFSYLSDLKEIEENNYDLSVKKYVKIQKKIEVINKEKIEDEINKLERRRYKIQVEIDELVKSIKK